MIDFLGYAYTRTKSDVSGAIMTSYDETKPAVAMVAKPVETPSEPLPAPRKIGRGEDTPAETAVAMTDPMPAADLPVEPKPDEPKAEPTTDVPAVDEPKVDEPKPIEAKVEKVEPAAKVQIDKAIVSSVIGQHRVGPACQLTRPIAQADHRRAQVDAGATGHSSALCVTHRLGGVGEALHVSRVLVGGDVECPIDPRRPSHRSDRSGSVTIALRLELLDQRVASGDELVGRCCQELVCELLVQGFDDSQASICTTALLVNSPDTTTSVAPAVAIGNEAMLASARRARRFTAVESSIFAFRRQSPNRPPHPTTTASPHHPPFAAMSNSLLRTASR